MYRKHPKLMHEYKQQAGNFELVADFVRNMSPESTICQPGNVTLMSTHGGTCVYIKTAPFSTSSLCLCININKVITNE